MEPYNVPLSQAEVIQEGSDVTLVAWGTQVSNISQMSPLCLEALLFNPDTIKIQSVVFLIWQI